MANLQVREIDNRLYERLKFSAKKENRSLSQQVITILQKYFTSVPQKENNATDEFLKLAGSWNDSRSSEEIIKDLRNSRVKSSRFGGNNGLFD
ncbi:MAG: antitoxin [Clostridia bacterium]|nr:antitoxin [Clostridia bacterium]